MTTIKPISNWSALAADAKRRGIDTVGAFIVYMAMRGVALDANAMRAVRRVYRSEAEAE